MRSLHQACVVAGAAFAILAAQPAFAADKFKVSIVPASSSAAPFYVGLDKGFFAQEGLDLELLSMPNPTVATTAVVSGDADATGAALGAGFYNVAGKGDIVMVAGSVSERPGFRGVAVVASKKAWEAGLKTPKDLVGKRVGVGSLGSAFHYDLILLADKYGFEVPTSSVVPLGAFGAIQGALVGGSLEAGVGPGVGATGMVQAGEGQVIAWIGDESPWTYLALIVNQKALTRDRPKFVRFMRAYLRAAALYDQTFQQRDAQGKLVFGADADHFVTLLANQTKQTEAAVRASLPFVEPKGALDMSDISKQVSTWQKLGLVDRDVDAKKVVDLSLLADAAKQ